tara:strand:+ start:205 stop:1011 length:807 start_codon:yes stop_codon:yes gene_type:complete
MAKKTTKTVTETVEEGTREPGEEGPKDDSEILSQSQQVIGGEEVEKTLAEEERKLDTEEVEMVEVAIGGELHRVPRATAEAFAAEQAATSSPAPAPDAAPSEEPSRESDTDYSSLLFTDTNEALRMHGEEVAKSVTERITGAYQQDQARAIFWDDFYGDNPELKEEAHIVKMVMNNEWEILKDLKGKTVRKKLAELTQKEILRLANKQAGITSKPGATTTQLEGDTQPAPAPASDEEKEEAAIPPTLNAAIKERNRKRRESLTTKQAS